MQNTVNGVPIASGTLARDLGGITNWSSWSNGSDANLEDTACTVRMLFLFLMKLKIELKKIRVV